MPNPKSPPRYRLHKARNLAVVTIDGKDVYLGPYGSPESHARYAELIVAKPVSPVPPELRPASVLPLTVGSLTGRFFDYAQSYYVKQGRPTAQVQRVRSALRELNRLFLNEPIATFGPLKLKLLQQSLLNRSDARVKTTAAPRTLSRNYINALVGCVVHMFKWGVSEELVPPHIYHALKEVEILKAGRSGARETEKVRPVPLELVESTLPYLPPAVAAMVKLQMRTGMRPGEVVVMKPADLVLSAEGPWTYCPERHKCEHLDLQRVIFIGPSGQDVLREWLTGVPAESAVFSPARKAPGDIPGQPFDKDTYRQLIQRVCKRQKLERWHPNQLRHLHATLVNQQFGIEAARVVLGHNSVDTTQLYAQRDLKLAADVQSSIG